MISQPIKLRKSLTAILILLFRFRFLSRPQIQTLLHHKSKTKVIIWLNELTKQEYIVRFYNPQFAGKPAYYCLGTKSISYLKTLEVKEIKPELLKRIYKERGLSDGFKEHCMFLAHIYISLIFLTEKSKAKLTFWTNTDLHSLAHLINPTPDCYFAIEEEKGTIKRYFLDIFDEYEPYMEYKRRVEQYIEYYESNEWQENSTKQFPEIILVCLNERLKRRTFRFIQKIQTNETEPIFYLSTWDELKQRRMSKDSLCKVT